MVDWHQNPQKLLLQDSAAKVTAMSQNTLLGVVAGKNNKQVHGKWSFVAKKPLVIMVGGALDDYFHPILRGVFVPYRLENGDRQDIVYCTHNSRAQMTQLVQIWSRAGQKICMVGHSWGGKTLFDVANNFADGSRIDLLVTLDPVAWRMAWNTPRKPDNVVEWLNVHVDYATASMEFSNTVARLGGYWGHCRYADRNIGLSRDGDREITHLMAARMFQEVSAQITEFK